MSADNFDKGRAWTVPMLAEARAAGRKLVMLTCYDASFARVLDDNGIDLILVGDSLGMVVQGFDSTLPVRVDDIVYHTASVARGARRALKIADFPFGSDGSPQEAHAAARLREDALAVAEAGAALLVLEGVPAALGAEITDASPIPTIGIGAGVGCDGQVLVLHDLLGLDTGHRRPKFVKDFLADGGSVAGAIRAFAEAVRGGTFPTDEHSYA